MKNKKILVSGFKTIVEFLVEDMEIGSKTKAKMLIKQGAIEINDIKITDPKLIGGFIEDINGKKSILFMKEDQWKKSIKIS